MKTRIYRTIASSVFVGLLVLLVFQFTMLSAAAAPHSSAPDYAHIDAYVTSEMQANHLPGLALGIVHGETIAHLHGFGKADQASRAVTPQTPFILGSTSKSFTALAIMQLVEAGKVDLDAPVQRYLPWFRVADGSASARISVRHLLDHTSGIPGTTVVENEMYVNDMGDETLEQFVRSLSTVTLDRPVGTSFEYANPNYSVLGLIVQVVSGQSYDSYIEQHIFAPSQMQNSFASKQAAIFGWSPPPSDAAECCIHELLAFALQPPSPSCPAPAPLSQLPSVIGSVGPQLLKAWQQWSKLGQEIAGAERIMSISRRYVDSKHQARAYQPGDAAYAP